jgi:hypothetical protein
MADRFMDQVGRLSWRTHILLEQLAAAIDAELPFWAKKARELGREHVELFSSCDEDTCPTVPKGQGHLTGAQVSLAGRVSRTQELVLLSFRSTTGIPRDDEGSDP